MSKDFEIRVKVKWNGDKVLANLNNLASQVIEELGQILKKEVTRKLTKTWGSDRAPARLKGTGKLALNAGIRIRKNHSDPNQAPFMQTRNLANSVRLTKSTRSVPIGLFTARVSTRVKYASGLEKGGPQLSLSPNAKRFTNIRLVNPLIIKGVLIIAPRPAWMPAFLDKKPEMIRKAKQILRKL